MSLKDEFINREPPQLPADTNVHAADMAQASAARADMGAAPLGTPPADYSVRSVYDSRPVFGTDFNVVVATAAGGGCASSATAFFTVPSGYVAVLRHIETWCEPIPVLARRNQVTLNIQLNQVDVTLNTDIPIGTATDLPIDCFVIADEGTDLGVQFDADPVLIGFSVYALLYGNLLLKTGRPFQFEIANYAGEGSITTAPRPGSPNLPPNPQAGVGGLRRRR